ncbi:MAG TPA: uroporphyrinogen-III C-methyltransferase [Acidimicrobiales bacterium]|nr:uroporphyrinogen-III C-methyltransferase [Acidimicrobiales bacterium]
MTVYLVGAGPGDPGLLTRRGAELLARAEVVVHDRLSEISLLDLAPPGAERIDVGKSPGAPVPQEDINALLVERGRRGHEVVRLKGGDPFVFGRGGEEALALAEAGIPFEVVPGVTAAVAVPAYAGIPVTHRGLSTSFTVVTGHSRHAVDDEVDWDALARAADTIVVLMGVAHRAEIAARLRAAGLPAETPVAAVRWGTRPGQRTVRTTLAGLPDVTLEPPVTLVIGRVAGLDLRWFEGRPLFGRRVVVTRARAQASSLVEKLTALGAETVELPTIEIGDPTDGGAALRAAAGRLFTYDWVVFTSANAVERLLACLHDARAFGTARVAAVGPGTAAALAARGVVADLRPPTAVAEALVESFPAGPGTVLLPQAAAARPVLAEGLRAKGWQVDVAEAYRTVPARPSPEALAAAGKADAVAFTSSSTVTSFLSLAGADALPPVVACIGPVTAATAAEHGVPATVVAGEHTVDGLVGALVDALSR